MKTYDLKLEVRPYGGRIEGVFVEPLMLERVSRVLKRIKGSEPDRSQFWRDFIELCNLSELVCLEDRLLVLQVESHDEYLGSQISSIASADLSLLRDVVAPFAAFTIDDLQKDRVFKRWMSFAQTKRTNAPTSPNLKSLSGRRTRDWLIVKQMLAGCLAEELVEAPYFPSSDNIAEYLDASPFWEDMTLYSLILDAYDVLKRSERSKRELRNLIGNIKEPSIPPVITLILSEISSPAEYLEELMCWREKFRPLRKRTAALKSMADSDLPMGRWLKEYESITNEVSRLAGAYGEVHSRIEVSKVDPKEFFDLTAKLEESPLDLSLDIKKLASLGLERIIHAIKRRRIQPLPSIKKRLAKIGKMSPLIEKVFGVRITPEDLVMLAKLNRPFEDLLKNRNARLTKRTLSNPQARFRSGFEALHHTERFNFERTLREFGLVLKAGSTVGYSKEDRFVDVGFLHLDFNNSLAAEEYFKKALDLNIQSARAFQGLGMLAKKLGNTEQALANLKTAVDISPKSSEILNDLAAVLGENGEDSLALTYLKRAVEEDHDSPWVWYNIGSCSARLHNYQDAKTAFQTALQFYPEFHGALFSLGVLEEEYGNLAESINCYQQVTNMAPSVARYWGKLGTALFSSGNYLESARALRKQSELDEQADPKTFQLLGGALYLAKRYEEAVTVFASIAALGDCPPEIHQHYGFALYELGRIDEAVDQFEESYRMDSSNPDPLKTIAKIHLENERNGDARTVLMRFLQVRRDDAEAQFLMGKSVFNEGDVANAIGHFQLAISCGFDEQDSFYNLGVRRDNLKDFKHAVALYRLELEVSDKNPHCLANLAADLCECGEYDEALSYAEKACALAPTDPINLLALANTLMFLQRAEEAAKPLSKIVALGTTVDETIATQAQKLLEWIAESQSI
jgi:tetratricopeptide (TPR) repeat protein